MCGEPNRSGGVQRLGLDRVTHVHAGDDAIGVRLDETVGQVTERQYRVGDAVFSERGKNAFDHGYAYERQHLLGRLVREGTKSSSLTADQDDRLQTQPFAVVVVV